MERTAVTSGTEWEREYGYARAVRAGDRVVVSGTTATDDEGEVVGVGDPYEQTRYAFGVVADALEEAGASVSDVVRTRMFVTDIAHQDAVGRAHGDVFGEVRPAATMVEVAALVDPDHLVEVEAEALVEG